MVALVGLVGVGMLGIAALLILSAILVCRANPTGAYVAMVIGGIYVLSGLCAFRAEWWWDAKGFALLTCPYGRKSDGTLALSRKVSREIT